MAVTESARHKLYQYFEETMGEERATILMELLPPVGWGDVATKQDLEQLRENLRNELTGTFERSMRTHTMATFGFFGIFMSLAVTLARMA